MGHKDCFERARELIREAMRRSQPIRVEPRHRISGPVLTPSDWWTDEGQKRVTPQCILCHERVLPSHEPLIRGLCGPCRDRTTQHPDAA